MSSIKDRLKLSSSSILEQVEMCMSRMMREWRGWMRPGMNHVKYGVPVKLERAR